jgi:hypothetical protein
MPAPAHFPEYFPNLFPKFSSVLGKGRTCGWLVRLE